MREIHVNEMVEVVSNLSVEANVSLGRDVLSRLEESVKEEESPIGKEVLLQLIENARIAETERIPICQDTGIVIIFTELGQDVHIVGGDLNLALQEGVRQGYRKDYLRTSVCHPLSRKNTGDNTPAIIYIDIVPGENIKIGLLPKGCGSENMSRLVILPPSAGLKGIKKQVIRAVKDAGPDPCPPIILGLGIGGSADKATLIAKKALTRPVGSTNSDLELASLEQELLSSINKLGIGPLGFGGKTTSLAVHIQMVPCHIASLPLAINFQCHAHRYKEAVI